MLTRRLEPREWQAYCDRMSKALAGARAQVEISGQGIGSQVASSWVPLIGVTYDPRDNLVEVILDGIDHMIRAPREIAVEEGGEGLVAMEIVDGDGNRQLVRFREALRLPAPHS